ncbi:MAG: transcriptional repressor LexA [Pirellulaceae bacterium]
MSIFSVYLSRMPLTTKQKAFLRTLIDLVELRGIPPTVREIQAAAGFASTRSVVQYLDALETAGFIVRGRGSRNLRILRQTADDVTDSTDTLEVPVIGTVAAGTPLLAEENIVEHRRVATHLLRRGSRHFLLKVRGDSMDQAGITDGDLVLVRQQPMASNGDRVVALIDQDATVKRLRMGAESVLLEPVSSNPIHKAIVVSRDFRIQGVVVAAIPKKTP